MGLTKCCCCVDLLKGVKILGIVLTIGACIGIIATIVSSIQGEPDSLYELIVLIPDLAVNIMLIWACRERKRVLILPWLVIMMLSSIGCLILIAVYIYLGATSSTSEDPFLSAIPSVVYYVTAFILLPFVALFFYFWATVLALYREMGREGNPYTNPESSGVAIKSHP